MKENNKTRQMSISARKSASYFECGQKHACSGCEKRILVERLLYVSENDGCVFVSVSIKKNIISENSGDTEEKFTQQKHNSCFFSCRFAFYITEKIPAVKVFNLTDDAFLIKVKKNCGYSKQQLEDIAAACPDVADMSVSINIFELKKINERVWIKLFYDGVGRVEIIRLKRVRKEKSLRQSDAYHL